MGTSAPYTTPHRRPAVRQTTDASCAQEPFFVARSPAMRELLETAAMFAANKVPVLITGASGSGKSYVAQFIHARSRRGRAPCHTVSLAGMDDALASAELFGHARGAFTGAVNPRAGQLVSANGGTVFLDEIGKASLFVQAKLLHVVERGWFFALGEDRPRPVDVRFIAAASEDLEQRARDGFFLQDLLFRLEGFRLHMPSLSERKEDIPDLIAAFAALHAEESGYAGAPPSFDTAVVRAMTRATWRSNLRGLSNAVRLAMMYAGGRDPITLEHCRGDLRFLAELGRKKPRHDKEVLIRALQEAAMKPSSRSSIRSNVTTLS